MNFRLQNGTLLRMRNNLDALKRFHLPDTMRGSLARKLSSLQPLL